MEERVRRENLAGVFEGGVGGWRGVSDEKERVRRERERKGFGREEE